MSYILCSTPAVQAILEGRQTQDRRLIKPQPIKTAQYRHDDGALMNMSLQSKQVIRSPFGGVGARLWVRETFSAHGAFGQDGRICYAADTSDGKEPHGLRWTPSIFMRRSACRIVLEVTGVRVEQLQLISEADAMAEGVQPMSYSWPQNTPASKARDIGPYRNGFRNLWESLYGPGSWDVNPWVWVTEFKRVTP
jgi:hypothetical protein